VPSGVDETEHPLGAFGDDRTAEQRLGSSDEAGGRRGSATRSAGYTATP
jgi:hypothetical protein